MSKPADPDGGTGISPVARASSVTTERVASVSILSERVEGGHAALASPLLISCGYSWSLGPMSPAPSLPPGGCGSRRSNALAGQPGLRGWKAGR